MSSPSDRHFDLNLGEEAAMPSPDNLWRPSFIYLTGPLTVEDSCASSVSNMAQRLFARTRQVESLVAEVMSLKQEIRGLKHENKQLHKLAHNYATNMKRKIDQIQEFDGQILLDQQRFIGLFQQHLPSSSRAVPRSEALNDQPSIPPPSVALPTAKAPPTTETSPKQPLWRLPLVFFCLLFLFHEF
ncbi:unnamed protein product [Malus baccata var. baccata]